MKIDNVNTSTKIFKIKFDPRLNGRKQKFYLEEAWNKKYDAFNEVEIVQVKCETIRETLHAVICLKLYKNGSLSVEIYNQNRLVFERKRALNSKLKNFSNIVHFGTF